MYLSPRIQGNICPDESPGSLFAFSDPTWQEFCLSQPPEGGNLGSRLAFACVSVPGATVLLWCFTGVEQLLSTSFLSFLAAPLLALLLERADFFGTFFTCAHWHFWVAGFFSSKCGINEPKGNLGHSPLQRSSDPVVPIKFAYSLSLSESSYVCFTYNVQGF